MFIIIRDVRISIHRQLSYPLRSTIVVIFVHSRICTYYYTGGYAPKKPLKGAETSLLSILVSNKKSLKKTF